MVQNLPFEAVHDRLPPQNVEAEESILGGILLDPEAIGRVMEILSPDAFYIGAHRDIYRAALDLHGKGQPTDLMTVTIWLKDHNKLEKVGGQARLAQLIDRTVSAANIDQYATLVMDKYTRRMLIQAGGDISQLGYDTSTALEQVLDQSEQKLFGITQVRPQSGLTATSDILIDTFAEIEQRSLGVVLPGIPCGFYDLDAMTQGFQRSDLIITAARPSMGKCLSAEAKILLADGRLKTLGELYHAQTADLLTLGPNWRFHIAQPSAYVDDGYKPVFRVRLRSGREVESTLTHPYLTLHGWCPLAELTVGEPIAVPRILPVFGSVEQPESDLRALAHRISQGNPSRKVSPLPTDSPGRTADTVEGIPQNNTARGETVGPWDQTPPPSTLPEIIFRLTRPHLALFLKHLLSMGGWARVLATGQAQIGWATASEPLARQVQHLLLRFGILAEIRPQTGAGNGGQTPWQIEMTHGPSIQTFMDAVGLVGHEAALGQIKVALAEQADPTAPNPRPTEVLVSRQDHSATSRLSQSSRGGLATLDRPQRPLVGEHGVALATALGPTDPPTLITGDVYWDTLVAIEPLGMKQVYDLTIPDTHNFVANDICVHNTSFVLNIARNIAALQKLPVAIYSLEMSKVQLVYRLLSSEVEMESSRLRTGRIAQNEWEKLGHAISVLSQMPIFIDDTPNISVTEIRSRCRRLQAEQGGALGLVLIDYLQLMEGGGDNRVQELSKMTRSLKGLARELNVPIIALSQLSRGVESRTNKRPMMSDLRECVTGDTLVSLADGRHVPIQDVVGQTPEVVSLDSHGQMTPAQAEVVWPVGIRPIYTLITARGLQLRATADHRLYTPGGWQRLKHLSPGKPLAVADSWPDPPSTVMWDEVRSITPAGAEPVYDLTVPGPESWLANGIISHNSGAIEQDADLIMMLYREEYYDPDTPDRGIAEVIITKHRNGPTGTVKLLFEPQFTRFRNLAHPGS